MILKVWIRTMVQRSQERVKPTTKKYIRLVSGRKQTYFVPEMLFDLQFVRNPDFLKNTTANPVFGTKKVNNETVQKRHRNGALSHSSLAKKDHRAHRGRTRSRHNTLAVLPFALRPQPVHQVERLLCQPVV